jgi:hypothetical protein
MPAAEALRGALKQRLGARMISGKSSHTQKIGMRRGEEESCADW